MLWEVKVIGVSVTNCSIFLISLLCFCLEIPLMICENRSGGLKLGKGRELKVDRSKWNFLNNDAITLTGTKDRADLVYLPSICSRQFISSLDTQSSLLHVGMYPR